MEDFPQFMIQLVYIFNYSEGSKDLNTTLLYVIIGLISFGVSVFSAKTAKSSRIDIKEALERIDKRTELI
jgi:hypothetical protein